MRRSEGKSTVEADETVGLPEFQWQVRFNCNYRCSYCPFVRKENNYFALDRDYPISHWIDGWKRFRMTNGEAKVFMTGGEPTTYPGFEILLKELSILHYVQVDTNLSWPLDLISDVLRAIPAKRLRFETTFHARYADLSEFVSKASAIRDAGVMYNCRWVAHPQDFERLENYRREFQLRDLTFAVTPFHGEWQGRKYPESYSEAEKGRIMDVVMEQERQDSRFLHASENVSHLLREHAESPRGLMCRSGQKFAYIIPDGTVYRCQQYFRRQKSIGNFFADDFRLETDPSSCEADHCGCNYRWIVGGSGQTKAV